MEQSGKRYVYHVATFNRYTLIPADNAREALEIGENHPDLLLNGERRPILTVRIASREEVRLWDEDKAFEARMASGR